MAEALAPHGVAAAAARSADEAVTPILACRGLSVSAGPRPVLRGVDLEIPPHRVTGIVGPSGAGKSTLLKCLNRLVDLEPELAISGDVEFHGRSIYARRVDPDRLRSRIGILFQQPVVFPRSIFQNTVFGLRHLRRAPRREWPAAAQRALERVHLWREVRDRLDRPAAELSVGQQQRLCLARTLALEPEVVLMDEPTSALDPEATEAIEQLVLELGERHTVVLVTHDPEQARRVCDRLACICLDGRGGELLEHADAGAAFADPRCRRTARRLQEGGLP